MSEAARPRAPRWCRREHMVHSQGQVNEHRGKADSQQVVAGRHELQVDPQEHPRAYHHEASLQQESASRHETDGELEGLSAVSRSLERGVPASVSSPNLLAELLQQHAAQSKQAIAQRAASDGNKMHRSISWGQAPAVISRLTSWKEAEKDYSAMQVALKNFPGSSPDQSTRAGSYQPVGTPLHQQDRELSSAPELFTDAAMRNALRKIAALQAKPQPRSRASSAHTSALNSSRVSSEAEAVLPGAASASASRDPSPLPRAAQPRLMQEAARGRLSYSSDLSGLPPGSRVASSDAGSVMGGSRPASTDASCMPKPTTPFLRSNDAFCHQRASQNPSEVLLSQPSRPTSVDLQAQASSSSRGPSGDLAQSSCINSSHLWPVQRKDDARGGHHSRQSYGESANEQHAHPAGSLLLHDGHARAANGALGASAVRQWGPAASGMRRVPENRAAEAYEVLMSRTGGSQGGSINSEDAAAYSAYVTDSLAWGSDRAQHGTESQTSGDSRKSSVGQHDGSAVVRPGDAHAALRRALSLVKKQGSMLGPEEAQEATEQHSQPSPRDWQSRQQGQAVLPKQGSEQPSDNGMMNSHGGYQSDAAMSAFIRKAFNMSTS